MSSPAPASRIPALTGLRFFLALWVILFHAREWVHQPQLLGIFEKGYLGVDFFFVLSGFILAHVYWPQAVDQGWQWRSHLRFVQKRFAKIWPVHLATFLVVLGIWLMGEGNWRSPAFCNVWQNLLMLDAWGLYREGCSAWNHPSWSISAEWFAYLLLFPLGAFSLRRLGHGWLPVAVVVSWLGLLAYCHWGLQMEGIGVSRKGFGILRILPEFLAGMWAYSLTVRRGSLIGRLGGPLALLLLGFLLTCLVLRWQWVDYVVLPVILFVLMWLGTGRGPVQQALSVRPLVYLGEISYSMYMVQYPVMLVLAKFWPRMAGVLGLQSDIHHHTASAVVYTLLLVAGSVVAASLSYHVVEEPCRKLLSGRGRKGHAPST